VLAAPRRAQTTSLAKCAIETTWHSGLFAMDGLSAAASVIAVLKLTGAVVGYLNDVENAPKECRQCTIEACNIQTLLTNLRFRFEDRQADRPWFTAVQALGFENGPLDQYKQALEQLLSMVETQHTV
jgi:hypothetical protein